MTKKLILFRHAKSDWDSGAENDHGRPLAERGIHAAEKMGLFLAAAGQLPDHIISSSANLAVETIEQASTAGGWNIPVDVSDDLYTSSASSLIRFLHQLSNELDSVMLVGHEPVWSELTSLLVGGGNIRMPTAAVVKINLFVDEWAGLKPGCGELSWLVKPKILQFL
ncbi:MAG TPA: histidine phosphatase family protein [Chromatiales bacterium]|nr:histidine phosphatase family protein [Thiotrichales bacterium]HIP67371.1 histidine phosphatase family protein [Chromatiales bacterium]